MIRGGGRGATCEAEALPDLGAGYVRDMESGDVQLVHTGKYDLQERSLVTGEVEPLITFNEPERALAGAVAADERNIFQATTVGIESLDRATRELSRFTLSPGTNDDPRLARPSYYWQLALSDTHLVAVFTSGADYVPESRLDGSYWVALIDRGTGGRRFIPIERPSGSFQLYVHGQRFFQVSRVDSGPNYSYPQRGAIDAVDFVRSTPEPFLQSAAPFGEYAIKFWNDSVLAILWGEGDEHWKLVRVPASGGEPEVLATDVADDHLAVLGNEAFVLLRNGTQYGQLTAIDLTNGGQRPVGTCDAMPFHASADYLYALRDDLGGILRITP